MRRLRNDLIVLSVLLLALPPAAKSWVSSGNTAYAHLSSRGMRILIPPPQTVLTTTTTTTTSHAITSTSHTILFAERGNDNRRHTSGTGTTITGLNELHTHLRDAVLAEDYVDASRISDQLARFLFPNYEQLDDNEKRTCRKLMSWNGLGSAAWLSERLNALNYTFPTTIQINAFQAVNAILNTTTSDSELEQQQESSTLEERMRRNTAVDDMGIVVSGTTGSGKTLAYAVPLLSTLSDSLFLRQRMRISDEEAVGDTAGDLVDRISVVTSPRLTSSSRRPIQKGPIATGASISTLGRSGRDVKSPLALVVVPTRELGVQTAMLLYQLVGGNIKDSPTEQSGKANMFKYKGPKGIRIGCVLDDEEASFGLKLQTDVAITTPQYLGKLLEDGDIDPAKLRVIVYDEADLALEQTAAKDLERLFKKKNSDDDDENTNNNSRKYSRLTLLVGASVTEELGNLAVSSRILPPGRSYIATATRFAALQSDAPAKDAADIVGAQTASLKDLNVCLYPGVKHERVIVKGDSGLLVLTRLLRKELQDYDNAVEAGATDLERPRVVVFFPDEPQAKKAIEPLRDALWGEHLLCVLLPKTGVSPLSIMDQFKKNKTSVMLATPNSVRGLDFPELSSVYTSYLPIDDPREYLHLAGRVGRVGHHSEGHVVSVLKEEEACKMDTLAETLGFEFTDIEAPVSDPISRTGDGEIDEDKVEVEKLRRLFEDTISLVDLAEDPIVGGESVIDVQGRVDDLDDDDDDDGPNDTENDDESSPFQ